MLLIIIALFWVAVLAPVLVRRFRDNSAEKSINSFHHEHDLLTQQEYSVSPAHRLEEEAPVTSRVSGLLRRPRLTVVHADDTYGSLESRSTWQEWSEDYGDEDEVDYRAPQRNRFAAAYASVPNTIMSRIEQRAPRSTSMKARRKMMFTRLVLAAVLLSAIDFVTSVSFFLDLAVLAWLGVVAFIGLAFYSVSIGLLKEESLPIRLPQRHKLATVKTLYDEAPQYEDEEFDDEFYDANAQGQWQRDAGLKRAFG